MFRHDIDVTQEMKLLRQLSKIYSAFDGKRKLICFYLVYSKIVS